MGGLDFGLTCSRAWCRLPMCRAMHYAGSRSPGNPLGGCYSPCFKDEKLNEAARESQADPKSQSRDSTPGCLAPGPSLLTAVLYFAEDPDLEHGWGSSRGPRGRGIPEGPASREEEVLSECLKTLSLVFLQPVRGDQGGMWEMVRTETWHRFRMPG